MTVHARRIAAAVLFASTMIGLGGTAGADHAGEAISVSKTQELNDGDTLTVSLTNFQAGGKPVKLVIAGQGKLTTIPDKLNFDEYAVAPQVTVNADGTGTGEIIALADHGTVQDGSTLDCRVQQCWVVAVQEPFLPQPNYATVPIYFAGGSVTPETTAPPATTPGTTVAPSSSVAPETTASSTSVAESTTTTTTEPTTTTVKVDEANKAADENIEEDGGGSGAVFAGVAAAVVALAAAGAVIAKKRQSL